MFDLGTNSIGLEVKQREFANQDRGVSPKGASDQTSFITALALLGDPKIFKCAEIFFANAITFRQDCIFTLTGAHYQEIFLNEEKVEHACVYEAKKGDRLRFKKRTKGFRVYLTASKTDKSRVGKRSKPYAYYFPQRHSSIRVTKGPEFAYLKEDPFTYLFKISTQSDMSGLRLEKKLHAQSYDIITAAVTDGTVQLSKEGPIILMRHRQTTGGYPRVFNVIEADMDRLAQYPHGASVKFELVSMKASVELLLEHEKRLQSLKESLA